MALAYLIGTGASCPRPYLLGRGASCPRPYLLGRGAGMTKARRSLDGRRRAFAED
ncbi:hypothetical protein AB0I81_19660 [Nonomuraea sp. NPDC050404]|uniref:hypothetical protein n=1 Tax=Nonomuraea sp. NPDC050404 TaxID=3155783 RepID=UPI0033CE2DC8